jgi:hypothetical protein
MRPGDAPPVLKDPARAKPSRVHFFRSWRYRRRDSYPRTAHLRPGRAQLTAGAAVGQRETKGYAVMARREKTARPDHLSGLHAA